jgi:hypothetical protein
LEYTIIAKVILGWMITVIFIIHAVFAAMRVRNTIRKSQLVQVQVECVKRQDMEEADGKSANSLIVEQKWL